MDWRTQAVAFYERACGAGLEAHPQVRAFIAAQRELGAFAKLSAAVSAGCTDTSVGSAESLAVVKGCTKSSVVRVEASAVSRGGQSASGTVALRQPPWGIACSGGADSLALLLWLYGAAQAGLFGLRSGSATVESPAFATSATEPARPAEAGSASSRVQSEAGHVPFFTVLHLDHNLRGAASAGDAVFVAQVAEALGWPFYTEQLPAFAYDVPDTAPALQAGAANLAEQSGSAGTSAGGQGQRPSVSEAVLRKARQAFFARSGCAVVFQGHHLGDVAETMLMRLAASSGLEGLAAPRPVSFAGAGGAVYLRPLLNWSKAQIVELLGGLGIPWREDASNAEGDYLRNRVRLGVVPALEQAALGRDVFAAAGASRARLQEDAEALEAWLDSVWEKATTTGGQLVDTCAQMSAPVLDWRLFAPLPRALRRRALWRLLGGHGLATALGGAAVDVMLDALETACEPLYLSAGSDWFLRYEPDSGSLSVVSAAEAARSGGGPVGQASQVCLPLVAGQTLELPNGATLAAERVQLDAILRQRIRTGQIACAREVYLALTELEAVLNEVNANSATVAMPAGVATASGAAAAMGEGHLLVRFWQAGDRYRPLGAPGSRKVQDVFTDKKVSAALRGVLPVVVHAQSGEVLWVASLPPAHRCSIGIGTKWALRLTYTPACKTLSAPIII